MTDTEPRIVTLDYVGLQRSNQPGQQLSPAKRQLLAILVAAGPAGLSADSVADQLWPRELPARWESALRMAFTRLRAHLGIQVVLHQNGWCRLDLPTSHVDLWELADLASLDQLDDGQAERCIELVVGEPLAGVETSGLIRAAIDAFEVDRHTVLENLARRRTLTVPPRRASELRRLAEQRSWDVELVAAIDALLLSGNNSDAGVIDSRSVDRGLKTRSRLIGRSSLVSDILELVDDTATAGVVLTGPSGSGLTALLDEIAEATDTDVINVVGQAGPEAAFGALFEGAPGLRPAITDFLASTEPESIRTAQCWVSALQRLESTTDSVTITVDDCELLDEHTIAFLGYLMRVSSSTNFTIVAALPEIASLDRLAPSWPEVQRVEVPPLDVAQVVELLASSGVVGTETQVTNLATDLVARTGGLAGRIARTVAFVDPETLTVSPSLPAGHAPGWLEVRLSDAARRVAAAATLAGTNPTLDLLSHVTAQDEPTVSAAVEELLAIGLLEETPTPDRFTVSNLYPGQTVVALVPDHTRRRFHLRASERTADVAARAWHLDAARPLVEDDTALAAHLEAAGAHLRNHSHREAVASFRAAERLGQGSIDPESLIDFAMSLERCGANGRRVRLAAIAAARNSNNERLALEAAAAGLPEAEVFDGDVQRLNDLLQIRRSALTRSDQHRHSVLVSRQHLLLGQMNQAAMWAERAASEAQTIDEQGAAWLAAEHIDGWRNAEQSESQLPNLDAVADPVLACRMLQAATISALVNGDRATARARNEELRDRTAAMGDPLRSWHSGLLRSLLAELDLEFGRADEIAESTVRDGVALGIVGAQAARRAQRIGRAINMHSVVPRPAKGSSPSTKPDPATMSTVAAASRLRLSWQSGTPARANAEDHAQALIDDATGSRFEAAVAGLLAPLAAGTRNDGPIRSILKKRRGTTIVVGAGLFTLGPAELMLASLATTAVERIRLLTEAVEIADAHGWPLWKLLTRIELHRQSPSDGLEQEIRGLAQRHGRHVDIDHRSNAGSLGLVTAD